MKFTILTVILLTSFLVLNAQDDVLKERNLERVHTDRSDAPYVTVTYDLDLKSNVKKDGITSAFVVTTISPESSLPVMVVQEFEIKCGEKFIRFATSAELKPDADNKFILGKKRSMTDEVFVNPFTDRGLKPAVKEAYKAIFTRSCTVEL